MENGISTVHKNLCIISVVISISAVSKVRRQTSETPVSYGDDKQVSLNFEVSECAGCDA